MRAETVTAAGSNISKKGGSDVKQYVVDVFTEQVFKGNPAAVCVMDKWPGDEFMIGMSVENISI